MVICLVFVGFIGGTVRGRDHSADLLVVRLETKTNASDEQVMVSFCDSDRKPVRAFPARVRLRGRSSLRAPKFSLNLRLEDEDGKNELAKLTGLPKGKKWVLGAAYEFDRALIRDAFMFRLG